MCTRQHAIQVLPRSDQEGESGATTAILHTTHPKPHPTPHPTPPPTPHPTPPPTPPTTPPPTRTPYTPTPYAAPPPRCSRRGSNRSVPNTPAVSSLLIAAIVSSRRKLAIRMDCSCLMRSTPPMRATRSCSAVSRAASRSSQSRWGTLQGGGAS